MFCIFGALSIIFWYKSMDTAFWISIISTGIFGIISLFKWVSSSNSAGESTSNFITDIGDIFSSIGDGDSGGDSGCSSSGCSGCSGCGGCS